MVMKGRNRERLVRIVTSESPLTHVTEDRPGAIFQLFPTCSDRAFLFQNARHFRH